MIGGKLTRATAAISRHRRRHSRGGLPTAAAMDPQRRRFSSERGYLRSACSSAACCSSVQGILIRARRARAAPRRSPRSQLDAGIN
eukprot:scaffold135629_cov32-Tisochrysis_lutea.AAC.1